MSRSPDALTADDIGLIYREVLGREPSAEEIAHQRANATSLRHLLEVVFSSPERRMAATRPASAGPVDEARVVNVFTEELASWGHPVGTPSPDGVAVVGEAGWVFLAEGTNAIVDQYRGQVQPAAGWSEEWAEAVALRRAESASLGADYAGLVVPDKLAVLTDHFPLDDLQGAEAPAARLAAQRELAVRYPVEELRAVCGGSYLRTDTHLTFAGNAALARVVTAEFGVALPEEAVDVPMSRYLTSGDLGSRFRPGIVELVESATDFGSAELVEDNHAEIAAVGGHIGTRRVLRNERAPDPRTAVVFGDSYAFPAAHYQGVAWFLAQVFRAVHFVWVPFGWDHDYVERVGGEVVVCQCAERFVIRPPAPRVAVRELARQTIARRRGLVVEDLSVERG